MRALYFLLSLVSCFACFAFGWNGGMAHQSAIDMSTGAHPAVAVPPVQYAALPAPGLSPIAVHFSPRGGCTQDIVDEIAKARSSILIQAYGFTSEPIGGALVSAIRRGVKVTACLDKKSNGASDEKSIAPMIAEAGAVVYLDGKHAISHSKVMVIDANTVITGSFNFTNAAEHSNLENLLVIHSKDLAEEYRGNFETHREHSVPLGQQ